MLDRDTALLLPSTTPDPQSLVLKDGRQAILKDLCVDHRAVINRLPSRTHTNYKKRDFTEEWDVAVVEKTDRRSSPNNSDIVPKPISEKPILSYMLDHSTDHISLPLVSPGQFHLVFLKPVAL